MSFKVILTTLISIFSITAFAGNSFHCTPSSDNDKVSENLASIYYSDSEESGYIVYPNSFVDTTVTAYTMICSEEDQTGLECEIYDGKYKGVYFVDEFLNGTVNLESLGNWECED